MFATFLFVFSYVFLMYVMSSVYFEAFYSIVYSIWLMNVLLMYHLQHLDQSLSSIIHTRICAILHKHVVIAGCDARTTVTYLSYSALYRFCGIAFRDSFLELADIICYLSFAYFAFKAFLKSHFF